MKATQFPSKMRRQNQILELPLVLLLLTELHLLVFSDSTFPVPYHTQLRAWFQIMGNEKTSKRTRSRTLLENKFWSRRGWAGMRRLRSGAKISKRPLEKSRKYVELNDVTVDMLQNNIKWRHGLLQRALGCLLCCWRWKGWPSRDKTVFDSPPVRLKNFREQSVVGESTSYWYRFFSSSVTHRQPHPPLYVRNSSFNSRHECWVPFLWRILCVFDCGL